MADSSKDLQLRELKDMINDLKKMIKTLQATVDAANKREEALTQERDNLKEEVALLRKKLFGSSSEKRSMEVPGQLNLFNEAEMEQDSALTEPEGLENLLPEKEQKKRKSRATNAERFKGIPVVKKYLDLSDEEKHSFGKDWGRIRTTRTFLCTGKVKSCRNIQLKLYLSRM